jgi:hypothetical protein
MTHFMGFFSPSRETQDISIKPWNFLASPVSCSPQITALDDMRPNSRKCLPLWTRLESEIGHEGALMWVVEIWLQRF